MFAGLKRAWHALAEGTPGRRFQDDRLRRKKGEHSLAIRVVSVVAGIALVVVGLVALVAPGPGILFVAFGGALVAREFQGAAKALDWLEVRGRRVWSWAKRVWRGAAAPVKALIIVVGLLGTGAAAWGAWEIFLKR